MDIKEHALLLFETVNGNMEMFRSFIPYVLLSDAIRAWTGPRQYSHFEKSSSGDDVSWMVFPEDIGNLSRERVEFEKKRGKNFHIADNIEKCVIGEETILKVFSDKNSHLGFVYRNGVEIHLVQDRLFDGFIRNLFDCDRKYSDIFTDRKTGREISGAELRRIISEMADNGVYVLSGRIHKKFGAVTNQEWINENIIGNIRNVYPSELTESVSKFLQIKPELDEIITSQKEMSDGDWYVKREEYDKLFNEAITIL